MHSEGIVIEPLDEDLRTSEEEQNYFPNTEAELEGLLNNPMMESESDEDDDDEDDFEKRARKMTSLTPDGGVKKKILRGGVVMDGDIPEKGSVTIHYTSRLEHQDEPFDSSYFRYSSLPNRRYGLISITPAQIL